MKILVIGASGLIGRAIVESMKEGNEILKASRSSGDFKVDISDSKSVEALFEKTGELDAIIIASGEQSYGHITNLTAELFAVGINNKVLGQINVVLAGQSVLKDGGSFTITSGLMTDPPFSEGICTFVDNAAIEKFVHVAALELSRGQRINAVSPAFVVESLDETPQGITIPEEINLVTSKEVAESYRKSIEEGKTGVVYKVWG